MTFRQLHVGRDEPILDPDISIIDAHHHLFDRPGLRYLFDDYLKDVRAGHRIVASVYVEAQAFPRQDGPSLLRPLGEVEFANGVAAMAASGAYGACRVCAAIVGYADLRDGDAVGDYLDRAIERAPDRFRGVRQIALDHPSKAPFQFVPHRPPRDLMLHPEFDNGVRQLAKRGLSFDAAVFHNQLGDVAALADRFPDMTIVVNHCGQAMGMGLDEQGRKDVFQLWRGGMQGAAKRPNVVCKVGGLGLPFWGFGFEERADPIGYQELAVAWKPYVETSIDLFGADRCMMESDYPPDSRSSGFVPLWNALKFLVQSATPDQKAQLFAGTAARVYRMNLPDL
jgi:predicted TIM-barrel fold metal-dependent hydrolase